MIVSGNNFLLWLFPEFFELDFLDNFFKSKAFEKILMIIYNISHKSPMRSQFLQKNPEIMEWSTLMK